jgi:hypothetical protein
LLKTNPIVASELLYFDNSVFLAVHENDVDFELNSVKDFFTYKAKQLLNELLGSCNYGSCTRVISQRGVTFVRNALLDIGKIKMYLSHGYHHSIDLDVFGVVVVLPTRSAR